ncbi:integrase [Herbaspirillum sp. meg3]|uniref:tyrosine-type recombinase/integrase n=1 Tax=Herbaspirillum sp. meg3 TaxID=2025949 RepID=UPI000B99C4FF|nr:site-specific integrase [Herbaspirillum sp. meg3]ASU38164.1 integrase [Herbaspirillum sp. meg3]
MATIRKRGNLQWQAIIRKRGFPAQSKTFNTKSEALAWAGHVESEMTRGVFVSTGEAERTTLGEALERYWTEVGSKKRHPDQERQRIDQWKRNPLAHNYLASLRGTDFARYRDNRRSQGRAENTIRLELQLVSHLFEIARKEFGMEGLANPLKNIRKPSGSKARDRRLRPGEYEKILATLASTKNPFAAPAFQLAIETCLRQGALFSLKWEWINLSTRLISIPITSRGADNKSIPAVLPLSNHAIQVLTELRSRAPCKTNGRVLDTSVNAVICIWKRSLKKLEIDDLRWHDLRHEGVTRLFEKGFHTLEVASVSGHRSMDMLRRYTHLNPESLLERLG